MGLCCVDLPADGSEAVSKDRIQRAMRKILGDLPRNETWDWTTLRVEVVKNITQGPPAVKVRISTRGA
jgi:hypothetical protein